MPGIYFVFAKYCQTGTLILTKKQLVLILKPWMDYVKEIKLQNNNFHKDLLQHKQETETKFTELGEKLTKITKSQDFISGQYENTKATQNNLLIDNVGIHNKLKPLEGRCMSLQKDLARECFARNSLEIQNCLEIIGIPVKPNEDCKQTNNIDMLRYDMLHVMICYTL